MLTIVGASSQSGNLLEIQNDSGDILVHILSSGEISGSDLELSGAVKASSYTGSIDYSDVDNVPYLYQGFIANLSGSAISSLGGTYVGWDLIGDAKGASASLSPDGWAFNIPSSIPSSSVFMVRMHGKIQVDDGMHLNVLYGTLSEFSSSRMQTFVLADSGSYFSTQNPVIVHPNHTIRILIQHPSGYTGGQLDRVNGNNNIEVKYIG